jgi:hypothetical protein
METLKTSYSIKDTNSGIFAKVNLPEGTFNLKLYYHFGLNGTREWEIKGNYPKEKYSISYDMGMLFILKIGGEFEEGQKINHKAFGKGIITSIKGQMIIIDFKGTKKLFAKSILTNFLK